MIVAVGEKRGGWSSKEKNNTMCEETTADGTKVGGD